MEFPNHEIAYKVFMLLNGQQIPNTNRNYKLNWASHGTSRHHQNNEGGGVMQRQGSMGPVVGSNAPMERRGVYG